MTEECHWCGSYATWSTADGVSYCDDCGRCEQCGAEMAERGDDDDKWLCGDCFEDCAEAEQHADECGHCGGSGGGRDEMRCPHCRGTGESDAARQRRREALDYHRIAQAEYERAG